MSSPNLSGLLSELVRAGATPGASVALSVNGKRATAASGVANTPTGTLLGPDSRFQIGCITKLLTSLVALELVSAGRLELDVPIGRYLQELESMALGDEITPRHLLSHTSGYRGVNIVDVGVRFYYDWNRFLQLLRSGTRRFAAGTVFDYEHTECVLLGRIVERITREWIHDLYDKMIWECLDIRCGHIREDASVPDAYVADHSFDAARQRYIPLRSVPHCTFWDASLSDLTVSLSDLVTLGEAAAGFTKHSIFSSSTIEMLREPQVALPPAVGGEQQEQTPVIFGMGCAQYGPSVFGHNGSARGQTCTLRFEPSTRTVLAVGLSCWRPHARDLVCERLFAVTANPREKASHSPATDWHFENLTGRYLGAHGVWVDVSANPGELTLDICNSSAPAPTRILLIRREDGTLDVQSPASHLTVGFFEAGNRRDALMLGLNAYCNETQDTPPSGGGQ